MSNIERNALIAVVLGLFALGMAVIGIVTSSTGPIGYWGNVLAAVIATAAIIIGGSVVLRSNGVSNA